MAISEKAKANKASYIADYEKEKIKQVKFKLNKEHDADIIKYLSTLDNVQGHLKKLLREEIARIKASEQ